VPVIAAAAAMETKCERMFRKVLLSAYDAGIALYFIAP
jgi:hypothetical protein